MTTSHQKANYNLQFFVILVVLSVASTLIHFLYSATHFAPFALIAPVNESVWEHSKILITPLVIFCIVNYFVTKPTNVTAYWVATAKCCLLAQLMMLVIYYTYTGILGSGNLVIDIILTYVCLFFALRCFYINIDKQARCPYLWIVLLVIQLILLIVFTYLPPGLPPFVSAMSPIYRPQ